MAKNRHMPVNTGNWQALTQPQKEAVIHWLHDNLSVRALREDYPGLSDRTLAAVRAHITRGTYER